MTLNTLVGNDFTDCVDGLEVITVSGYSPETDSNETYSYMAQLGPITTVEAEESNGKYTEDDLFVNFKSDAVPYVGWNIHAHARNATFTIIGVSQRTGATRQHCVCRLLYIAALPRVTINIERARYEKDATGAPNETWLIYKGDIGAHLQVTSGESEEERQRTHARRFATLYMDSTDAPRTDASSGSPSFDGRYRIVVNGHDCYRVLGWQKYQNLERYLEVRLELVPWWPGEQ